jgi:hypothetical protein
MKVVVTFLVTVSLLISSPPVLAAIAGKCCMKKQMSCHAAGKTGPGKNRVYHPAKQMPTGGEYAPSKGQSAPSNDPVICCEKNCYPQLAETASGKQLVYKKTGVDSVATFSRVHATIELGQERASCSFTRDRPLSLHSPPLYSLNSAYLI